MAHWIDRAALSAALAAGYYLFFLNAWRSIPAACLAAFLCCGLTRRLLRGLPLKRRMGRARAREELLRIAALPDAEAEALLEKLLRGRYPDEAFELAAALKHPEASLSCGDVLAAWKAHRTAERLVIAATCPCEPRALLYARELRAPRVAVADSRALSRLLRRSAPPDTPAPSPLVRLRRFLARACAARPAPRSALIAAALLGTYLAWGNPLNLLAALALLARLGAALPLRGPGRRLFDGE